MSTQQGMIERVAESIRDRLRDTDSPLQLARAAIEAMREPTEAMVDAGLHQGVKLALAAGCCGAENIVAAMWRGAIDAILAEQGEGK